MTSSPSDDGEQPPADGAQPDQPQSDQSHPDQSHPDQSQADRERSDGAPAASVLDSQELTPADLVVRLRTPGDLTAAEVAALTRLHDGHDGPDSGEPGDYPWDDYPPGTGSPATTYLADLEPAPPPDEWLAVPDEPMPPVPEVLEAGFTRRYPSPGATGFASGGPLDVMLPGSDLAWHAAAARRADVGILSDNELCGLMHAARKLSSWADELELRAAAELDARRAAPDGTPGEHVAAEVGAELTLTGRSADTLLGLSRDLARLGQTRALLAAGIIDRDRAKTIASWLSVLDDAGAAAVENMIAPEAWRMTTGQLASACEHAIKAYDPAAAIRRRKKAQKDARVECWAEPAGTAAIAGRDLPPARVISADQTLDADARWLRRHGAAGSHDQLRAAALLARLTGQPLTTLLPPTPGGAPTSPADPATTGPVTTPGWPAGPAGVGSVNLTMPASAWLGLSDNPGQAGRYGALDAPTCRELAAALAAQPAARWCVTLVDPRGRAVAHGCARAGPGPPGQPGATDPAAWLAKVTITPLETGDCAHPRESAGYHPAPRLRHLIKIRDRRCGYPGCRRPAVRCDDDHTVAYHLGGKTCECNLYPLCRYHHRCKQAPGWHLTQPHPGQLTWTLPNGRTYTPVVEPYPL
jgi:hypothetical protein